MRTLSMAIVGTASILYLYSVNSGIMPVMIWVAIIVALIMITPNDK